MYFTSNSGNNEICWVCSPWHWFSESIASLSRKRSAMFQAPKAVLQANLIRFFQKKGALFYCVFNFRILCLSHLAYGVGVTVINTNLKSNHRYCGVWNVVSIILDQLILGEKYDRFSVRNLHASCLTKSEFKFYRGGIKLWFFIFHVFARSSRCLNLCKCLCSRYAHTEYIVYIIVVTVIYIAHI